MKHSVHAKRRPSSQRTPRSVSAMVAGLVFTATFVASALALPLPSLADDAQPQAQAALVHHPVNTQNAAAQRYFDEGLTLIYAFNREEAHKRFEKASKADPNLAMAYWGMALAVGPNVNVEMEPADLVTAAAALKKARALENGALPEERRYIDALSLRYPVDPKASTDPTYRAYSDAMLKLYADYPLDDDAAALSVESAMDVRPWGWNGAKAVGATPSYVATLEGVLRRNPDHVGANHYLVHMLDAQPSIAQGAEASARRLSALPVEPAASHLVHMAGHTDLDLGNFPALVREGRTSVDLDLAYAASLNESPTKLDYFGHNLDFYSGGALMLDDKDEIARALGIAQANSPGIAALIFAQTGRWDDALALPKPKVAGSSAQLRWRYARVMAYAAQKNLPAAESEFAELGKAIDATGYGSFLLPVREMAAARLALLRGDDTGAVADLRRAIAAAESAPPEVFAPWYFPAGNWLGWILLGDGDAAGAENAFRAALARTPHDARVLYGLMQALGRQGRLAEARVYSDEIAANWRGPLSDLAVTGI